MDDEQGHAELVSISSVVEEIRNNNPNIKKLDLTLPRSAQLSDTAWKLFGRYIANNTYLENLISRGLTDERMVPLFRGLTKSSSIEVLNFDNSRSLYNFGAEGIRSMTPFLQNSPKLIKIDLSKNNIDSQGFESLVNALDGGKFEDLPLNKCSITDISALGNVTLPHLRKLDLAENSIQNIGNISTLENYTNLIALKLSKNSIGIEGCRAIAHLLQKEDTNLEFLDLEQNGIGGEGIEVLANSLKHNTKLNGLFLQGNNISAKGYQAIVKMLVDVSSIENTYNNSNHTIKTLNLNPPMRSDERIIKMINILKKYINAFTKINNGGNPGRTKVIQIHLKSHNRKDLCWIQGIEYSHESIFSEIDPLVLPEVLSFVARKQIRDKNAHLKTQTELFRMLVTVAPDLSSTVNRPLCLKERIEDNEAKVVALGIEHEQKIAAMNAKHEREVAVLNAKKLEMKRELEALQTGEKTKDKEVEEDEKLSGKKRDRS